MNKHTKRIRMFAGPNGSGKSTIKKRLRHGLIGIYINPDEIEKDITENGFLNFAKYNLLVSQKEVFDFFENSSFLKQVNLLDKVNSLQFKANKLVFKDLQVNSYFASVASDFIRHELLKIDETFTFSFETVMSSVDKVEFLKKAQELGFRTYLYYIATEKPSINIERVAGRVKRGGHPVPKDKIIARYYRSLELLFSAIQFTNRAYIFDNSAHEDICIAEITNGKELEAKIIELPDWFKQSVWDKFESASLSK